MGWVYASEPEAGEKAAHEDNMSHIVGVGPTWDWEVGQANMVHGSSRTLDAAREVCTTGAAVEGVDCMTAADSMRRFGAPSSGRKLEVLEPANIRTPPAGDTTNSLVEPYWATKSLHGKSLELRKRNIGNDSSLTSMIIHRPTPKSARSGQEDSTLPNPQ